MKEEKIAEEKKSQNFGELTSKYQTVTNEIKLKEKKIESLQDEIEMEKKKNDKLNLLEKVNFSEIVFQLFQILIFCYRTNKKNIKCC